MKEPKNKKTPKVLYFVGGIAITATGFIVIPPLIKKYSNKVYKESLADDVIDFDNMGPEIIKKEINFEEDK